LTKQSISDKRGLTVVTVYFGTNKAQYKKKPCRVILSVVCASYSRVQLIAIVVGLLRLFTKTHFRFLRK